MSTMDGSTERNCCLIVEPAVSKTIHALPQGVTNQIIKDAVLRNHSNLRTVSQRSNAYQQLHQKPDEVAELQHEVCFLFPFSISRIGAG